MTGHLSLTVWNFIACATDQQSLQSKWCCGWLFILTQQQWRSIMQAFKKDRQMMQADLCDMLHQMCHYQSLISTCARTTIQSASKKKTKAWWQTRIPKATIDTWTEALNTWAVGRTSSEWWMLSGDKWCRAANVGISTTSWKVVHRLHCTKMQRQQYCFNGLGLYLGQELWNVLPTYC